MNIVQVLYNLNGERRCEVIEPNNYFIEDYKLSLENAWDRASNYADDLVTRKLEGRQIQNVKIVVN